MIRRKHEVITPKMLKKAYVFSEWDFCPKCRFVQHYNMFKTTIEELAKKLPIQGSLIKD